MLRDWGQCLFDERILCVSYCGTLATVNLYSKSFSLSHTPSHSWRFIRPRPGHTLNVLAWITTPWLLMMSIPITLPNRLRRRCVCVRVCDTLKVYMCDTLCIPDTCIWSEVYGKGGTLEWTPKGTRGTMRLDYVFKTCWSFQVQSLMTTDGR